MKKLEVRCSNIVKKGDRNGKCGAFLLEMDEFSIRAVCRKCGTLCLITRDMEGKYRLKTIPKVKQMISNTEKKDNGDTK